MTILLRKISEKDGKPYQRRASIEQLIDELVRLPMEEVVHRYHQCSRYYCHPSCSNQNC